MKNYLKSRFYSSSSFYKNGFTLLELLVVIGIIGVMMALATVAYSQTQLSGRNTRRKQDLVAIQNALEQYYSASSFAYPIGTCTVASAYLKSAWPVDPTSTTTTTVNYAGDNACTASSYCICATLEGTSGSGNSSTTSCTFSAGGDYYCVGNLQ